MNDYYLRCRWSDLPQLVALGQLLGVIQEVDNVVSPIGAGCWDEIGLKYPQVAEGEPTPDPVGGTVDPYWHINFRTEHNLREKAEALAAERPEIAAGLANLPRFFLTDAEGSATAPEIPLRVFL